MKNQILIRTLNSIFYFLFVICVSLLVGCSDDPVSTNEEEVITTVLITLDPVEGTGESEGAVITLSWDDVNLDAIVDVSEVTSSGSLLINETYKATIQMLNKSGDSEVDITEEVKEEAEDHIFCFEVTGVAITITDRDEDKNGLPLGLESTWTTTSTIGSGSVNITLRHQPGVKTGDCPGAGETDADITFTVSVNGPV